MGKEDTSTLHIGTCMPSEMSQFDNKDHALTI